MAGIPNWVRQRIKQTPTSTGVPGSSDREDRHGARPANNGIYRSRAPHERLRSPVRAHRRTRLLSPTVEHSERERRVTAGIVILDRVGLSLDAIIARACDSREPGRLLPGVELTLRVSRGRCFYLPQHFAIQG